MKVKNFFIKQAFLKGFNFKANNAVFAAARYPASCVRLYANDLIKNLTFIFYRISIPVNYNQNLKQ